jgi:aryl-alcohol dehydrogenase-like predicted oxidoreductase
MIRLVLGTAQLGQPYGIANTAGQPNPATARGIVAAAWQGGIRYFDTAQIYGQSESVLGHALRVVGIADEACIITKIPPGPDSVLTGLRASCNRLGLQHLWGLLLHREEQLDQWDGPLGEALSQARDAGLIEHAGVSVYSAQRALQALELNGLDALQAPANVFDRRLKRAGVFERTTHRNVTIFLRSVYLQGLALMSVSRVAQVAPFAVPAVKRLEEFCHVHHLDRREFALRYALALDARAQVIIGAETPAQVTANCRTATAAPLPAALCAEWDTAWPDDDETLINPGRWPTPPSQ